MLGSWSKLCLPVALAVYYVQLSSCSFRLVQTFAVSSMIQSQIHYAEVCLRIVFLLCRGSTQIRDTYKYLDFMRIVAICSLTGMKLDTRCCSLCSFSFFAVTTDIYPFITVSVSQDLKLCRQYIGITVPISFWLSGGQSTPSSMIGVIFHLGCLGERTQYENVPSISAALFMCPLPNFLLSTYRWGSMFQKNFSLPFGRTYRLRFYPCTFRYLYTLFSSIDVFST